MIVYGFIYDKIKNIPSIEVSDKDKLKKKNNRKFVTLILKYCLDIVIGIKEKET